MLNKIKLVVIQEMWVILGGRLVDVYKRQVYVDDILIASRTFTEHLEHIEYVLDKLQKGGLTVNWDKSKFLQTEIHFLGFIITQEGILANPDKVPVSYTHLRSS